MSHDKKPEQLPPRAMRRNLGQLGNDVVTLAELQVELLQVDMRDWLRACTMPMILLAAGVLLGLASFPVLLLSLAYALGQVTEWSLAVRLLAASGAGLIVAGIFAVVAVHLLRRDAKILSRSTAELRRNVRWLKEVLTQSKSAVVPE
jgi:hypothetical protein